MAVIMRRGEFALKNFGRYHRRHTIFPNTIQLRLLSSSSSSRPSSEKNAQTLEKSIWGSGTYADDVATITDVTLPELIWSNVRKWEDLPAYVSFQRFSCRLVNVSKFLQSDFVFWL